MYFQGWMTEMVEKLKRNFSFSIVENRNGFEYTVFEMFGIELGRQIRLYSVKNSDRIKKLLR